MNLLPLAVWGSLAASVVLGCFLAVQALVDRPRALRYGLFALSFGYLVYLDFSFSFGFLPPEPYEIGRLVWCGAYAGAVLWLFGHRPLVAAAPAVLLPAAGLGIFFGGAPHAATTCVIPLAFGIAAVAHFLEYRRARGFASAILCAYSTAVALMCALFLKVMGLGDPLAGGLGYLHYAEASVVAVLLGWVHLPRELRGQAPVRMEPRHAAALIGLVVGLELAIQAGIFWGRRPFPWLYAGAQAAQLLVTLGYYFRHRHQLVIHAENVSQLLDERTAELRAAQAELARRNETLAERVDVQEKDLRAKREVIDRQRRLELAAQTAGQVAHDIQNLVSPVLARLDHLEGANASAIRKQVNQVLELNTQLLALSRRGRVEAQPVSLEELARDVAERFGGQRLTIDANGPAWVSGSFAQLGRAVSNLVTNALESDLDRLVPVTLRTGTLELSESRRCHLGFLGPGKHAFIEVADAGPGIPEAHLDRIFEPFFSSKGGRTRSGSGLGLTIVAAVVDDHKGVLDLATGPDGTRFSLFFPAIEPAAEVSELVRLSCNATVLVVDDDSDTLRDYGDFLPRYGWTVVPAGGGDEAIRILQARRVDVVLLDLQMPRMSGLETLFAAIHVRPGVRAVVHSSHIAEEQALKLRALGASALLLKPAGRGAILRALREALDERPAADARPRRRSS
jgi:signal transduction histidine kinase/ActR/RegA family two-component response regulator